MNSARIIPLVILAFLITVQGLECNTSWAAAEDLSGTGIGNRQEASSTRGGNAGWTTRVITNGELDRMDSRDWDLSPSLRKRILARLNVRDPDYIAEDIKRGKPLKVPDDFSSFKNWTPLQKYIADVADLPKFILVVRDIPFIGWYERGRLVGDTYICIGKQDYWTRDGLYTVREKDIDHVSRSYPNAYGEPAPMPWALRIYEHVWIHAGDITGGYCSHGCINLPIFPAMRLFDWATPGTLVLIVDSLGEVPTIIARNRGNCSLFASHCIPGGSSAGKG